jgi:hypothetical protein
LDVHIHQVSASEHDLLTITRTLVGEGSVEAVEPILREKQKIPEKLGPTAAGLLRATLARGVVRELARRGGWRRERRPTPAGLKVGRVWERNPMFSLRFSKYSMQLLRWLLAEPLGSTSAKALTPPEAALTLGDEVLQYLLLDAITKTNARDLIRAVVDSDAIRSSALCWLGFCDVLCAKSPPKDLLDRFSAVATSQGIVVLEALQDDLARRWVSMERRKRSMTESADLIALGQAQEAVLGALFTVANQHKRRDLTGFVVEATARLLPGPVPADVWIGQLDPAEPLSVRQNARRAAGALLRAVKRWKAWDDEHRSVRFFDDDYDLAQALLNMMERLGEAGVARSDQILSGLSALDATITEEPKTT